MDNVSQRRNSNFLLPCYGRRRKYQTKRKEKREREREGGKEEGQGRVRGGKASVKIRQTRDK